jgi:hypothetical protein
VHRRDVFWHRVYVAVLGPPPRNTGPGYELAKLRYLRRFFLRFHLPATLAICAACVLWGSIVELPFAFVLLVVWALFVVRINARIRRVHRAQAAGSEARTSSAPSGVRS